jgi:hypothetical protein
MADDVQQEIENALNTIASSTEQSTKMKKELKQTIYDTVSTLRKLFVKLKEVSDSKTRMISELQTLVATTKTQHAVARDSTAMALATPSIAHVRELARSGAPSDAEAAKQHKAGTDHGKLYSEALRGKVKHTHHTLTVSSNESKSADTIKEILKSNINPTEIQVGINALKTLRNGMVQIEAQNKEDVEKLTKDIKEKCGDKLTVSVRKLRNPRLVIYDIPEDITIQNIEDTIIAQNPELNLNKGDIIAKFAYVTKRNIRNLVMEVTADTRRQIIQKKVKLGWIMCKLGDYLVANRCHKCSKFNHRARECRGIVTCPLCAENHSLKECTATPDHYKCNNCHTFNTYNKDNKISDNHSSLDRNCPSLQAVLEKYKRNTDY